MSTADVLGVLLIFCAMCFLFAIGWVAGTTTRRSADELGHMLYDREGKCDWSPYR